MTPSVDFKTRVVYLIGSLEIGGSEAQVVELATRLDRTRFEPRICAMFRSGALVAVAQNRGVPVDVLGPMIQSGEPRGVRWLKVLAIFFRLVRYFQQTKPQIVHAFLYWAYVPGSIAARLARVSVFVSSRRGLGLYRDSRPFLQWLENIANRLTDLVVVNSEAVRRDVLAREKIAPDRIKRIYNGVDVNRYVVSENCETIRKSLGINPQARVIGVVANLIPYKGHHEMIEAYALVAAHCTDTFLLLVGEDRGIQSELEQLSSELGVRAKVVFAGARSDVPQILCALDVQAVPSHEEGFSNAILEGMAVGKPLVVTAVGGNSEAVVNGETGWVVPPHAPRAMADAILRLLDDPLLARRMGEAGQERIKKFFGIERMIGEYDDLYTHLLRQKAGKHFGEAG